MYRPARTGARSRVRIRGTNSISLSNDPIYIIHGVRMTSNATTAARAFTGCTDRNA